MFIAVIMGILALVIIFFSVKLFIKGCKDIIEKSKDKRTAKLKIIGCIIIAVVISAILGYFAYDWVTNKSSDNHSSSSSSSYYSNWRDKTAKEYGYSKQDVDKAYKENYKNWK